LLLLCFKPYELWVVEEPPQHEPLSASSWWNSSWQYRQAINISNTAGNLTDYQVKIELNSSNVGEHFNWSNSGKDLRFVDSDDTTELPYYIEGEKFTIEESEARQDISDFTCWGCAYAVKMNSTHLLVAVQDQSPFDSTSSDDIKIMHYNWQTNTVDFSTYVTSVSDNEAPAIAKMNGSWFLFYAKRDGSNWDLVYKLSDDAKTWGGEYSLIEDSTYRIFLDVVPVNTTHWLLVYMYRDASNTVYLKQKYFNNLTNTFTSETTILTSTTGLQIQRLFKDDDGAIYLYYDCENTTDYVLCVRNTTDNGETWSSKSVIDSSLPEQVQISVIKSHGKYIYVIYDNSRLEFYESDYPDRDFKFNSYVVGTDSNERCPFLVKHNESYATLIYSENKSATGAKGDGLIAVDLNLERALTAWVKANLSNGTNQIYMYYGNPSAVSKSNGTAVFDFFDDFEDGIIDTSKWSVSGTVVESEGKLHIPNGGTGDNAFSINSFGSGYILETEVNVSNDGVHWGWANSTALNTLMDFRRSSGNFYATISGGTDTNLGAADTSEHEWNIVRESDSSEKYYKDGTLVASYTITISEPLRVFYRVYSGSYSGILSTDWVRVRKFADPEPSVSSFGSEETAPAEYSMNLSFGPPGTTKFIFAACGPDFENATATPINQTDEYGIDLVCRENDGLGGTAKIQIKLSGPLNPGWTWYASNESDFSPNITLTTEWQDIIHGLEEGECAYVWHFANCSYVHERPGAYQIYRIVGE